MEQYTALISVVSLSMGAAWASGINLYAAMLMLGLGGATGNIALPEELEVLQNPLVIGAAGIMYLTEFFVDKIPGLDSSWDALHTFIRIPAGALLAAGAVGDVTPALGIAAGILGGGMAATSHATKAGTRLAVNTSPEPFSNWGLSITEDIAVFAGLWAALNHPWIFLGLLILFMLFAAWIIPRIWRFVKLVFRKLGELLGLLSKVDPLVTATPDNPANPSKSPADEIERLKRLLDQGAISETEYQRLKDRLLNE